MAQQQAFDPRAEALASSRKRSGSTKMDNIENHPPLNPVAADGHKSASQFNNLRTRFEDRDGGGGSPGSKTAGHYVSTVSKMKERFQHSGGGKGEEGAGDVHSSTSSTISHSLPTRAGEGSDRSPEVKRKKVTEGHPPPLAAALDPKRRTSSVDGISSSGHMHHTPPLSPTHSSSTTRSTHPNSAAASLSQGLANESKRKKAFEAVGTSRSHEPSDAFAEPTLLEATSHVQRFNYTRALFARMEEETRRAQERDKVMRRKLSPSRYTSSTPSPLLSPTAVSPVQESRKFPPPKEQHEPQRSKSTSDAGYTLGSEPPPSESFRSSHEHKTSEEHHNERKHSQFSSSIPQQNQPKPSNKETSTQDQVMRSRRPHKTPFKRDDSGDRSGKYYQSVDAFNALEEGLEKAFDNDSKDVNTNENTLGGDPDSVDSSCSSPPPFIPHSSKLEHSIRPSHRSRSQASTSGLSSSSPSSHSRSTASRDSDKPAPSPTASSPATAVVRRPRKQPSGEQPPAEETAKKRLSKEEIEAALERADSYLANLGSPDDVKSEEAKKERQMQRSQNHAQSAAARRRFLYGEDSGTPDSSSQEISQRQGGHGQLHDNGVSETSETESKFIDSSSVLSSSTSSSPAIPSSPVKSSAYVQLKSQSSSSDATTMDLTPDLPPPSYQEATEPPPYHEATSTSSMLISQKVLLSQQQPKAHTSGSQPVPVPRRAAPPPPLPKKPASGSIHTPGAPPPPAPEPGSVEYIRRLDTNVGNRNAVILDSESADDLILPEEHIARHSDEDLENGNVDSSSTSFSKKDFLIARESGDGKEDTTEGDLSDSEPLEIDYQNLTFIEIPPISSEEEDESSGDEIEFHKASRVCFSRSPIRVFATYSTNDYDRRNEDVDPVAASAEYELEKRVEKMDVFPVQLQKGAEGLGLSIIGMGVGADAGLEKLGIFIKTLTPNGAAQKSSLIQVNDQIIEVDGKSLVGVTQAYAASVLRNTSGHVNFLIGREKDPSKSEVARLIQQSLEQDRRREEMKEKEQQRLRQLEDSFLPKDEVLERHAHAHLQQQSSEMGEDTGSDTGGDEKGLEESQEKDSSSLQDQEDSFAEQERLQLEQESAAGDTTPQSAPSNGEDGLESSPETSASGKDVVDAPMATVEGQQSSSSDSISPDMENEKLYVKLKESQYKLAVADAERAKLKAKILVLEGSESQKKTLEKKVEELTRKFQDRDKHFDALKKELSQYKDMMVASQSQHIELERKVKELGALEKKYHKAKKLIKDYQQREKDFIQERESLFEQQAEKDQQYNSLVKSLKDRIFTLEKDLTEAQKAAGLPQALPTMEEIDMPTVSNRATPLVKATLNGLEEPLSPLNQSTEDALETSTSSEVSDPATSPVSEEAVSIEKALVSSSTPPATSDEETLPLPVTEEPTTSEFDSVVNSSPLLDSSASRDKGNLATAGSNANRRPPSKKSKAQDSSKDQDSSSVKSEVTENGSIHSSQTDQAESGLDMWNKHDSTVRKSELKKRKQFQQPPEVKKPLPQPSSSSPSIPSANKNTGSISKPPVAPKPNKSESLKTPELSRRDDSYSDTSSSVSQTSYDPNRPNLKGGNSEIPDIAADNTSNTSDDGVTLVSAKASSSAKGFSLPKFNWKPSSKGRDNESSGGVVLLSNRTLASKHSASDPGIDSSGITLISKKVIDTGYEDYDAASINSDITSSMMVTEPDVDSSGKFTLNISGTPAQQENLAPSKRNQNQFQSGPINEWDTEHVCHWLMALELEKYSSCFRDKNITGSTLLQLDGSKLKSIGVTSSKDRELLKKKIKEMKANVEREKKIQEKERKQKEKEQKKMSKKK